MINVTKSNLPPFDEYVEYLRGIWDRNYITNFGPLSLELEKKLKEEFQSSYLFFLCNGTIALQIAIKALDLKGEIITTPFSYVATTSTIAWESCTPVFADIEENTLTINPAEIEKKITDKTSAIMATHVYGNPCDVDSIEKIAQKYNLKVIYDAAHCFGVKYKGKSLVNYGDVSTLSFHATKIFNTVEGGAVITQNPDIAKKLAYLRNFGHKTPDVDFWGIGINGKNSELHAAMGLCNLPRVKESIKKRKTLSSFYDEMLLENTPLKKIQIRDGTEYNFAYYPIIFPSEKILLEVKNKLNENSIFPRRYFYPSLNTLNYVDKAEVPISEDISKRILCLPFYDDLSYDDIELISDIIKSFFI